MGFSFGVKKADEPEFTEGGTTGGSYIRYFEEGTTRIRIHEEINDWTSVWMHFNQTKNREYPCTDDRENCPGHNSENERERKASKRYIVNATVYDVEKGEYTYTNLYKIPYSIIDDFMRFEEKFGTLMDRDYEIIRKKGTNGTSYSVDRCDPEDVDHAQYSQYLQDHQEALAEAFREVWGGLPDEDEYTGGSVFGLKPVSTKIKKAEPVKTWTDEEEPPPFKEPAPTTEEEDRVLEESDLRKMGVSEIIGIYEMLGLEIPEGMLKETDTLVDHMISSMSSH